MTNKEIVVYATHTRTSTLKVSLPFYYRDSSVNCTVYGKIDELNHITVTIGDSEYSNYYELDVEKNNQPMPAHYFQQENACSAGEFESAMLRCRNAIDFFLRKTPD